MKKRSTAIVLFVIFLVLGGGVFLCLNQPLATSNQSSADAREDVQNLAGTQKAVERKKGRRIIPAGAHKKPTAGKKAPPVSADDDGNINFETIDDDIQSAVDDEDFDTAVKLIQAQLKRTKDPEKIVELLDTLSSTGLRGLSVISKYMGARNKEIRDAAIDAWRQEIDMLDLSAEKTALIDLAGKSVVEDELSDVDAVQSMIDSLFEVSDEQAMTIVLEWLKVAKGSDKIRLLMEDLSFRTSTDFSSERLSQQQVIREAEAMVQQAVKDMKE